MKKNRIIFFIVYFILQMCVLKNLSYAVQSNEEQILENGVYTIASSIDNNYVIDVAGPSKDNEANIQLFTKWNTNAQKFEIKYLNNGYYNIISKYSNKLLDVAGAGKNNATNVQQYEANETDAQIWKIIKNSDNTYSIISKCNNLYLDVDGANAKNNTNIQMYEGNKTKAQKFVFERENKKDEKQPIVEQVIENGIYEIASAINQKYVLDVAGPSKNNETNIQLYTKWNTDAQKFEIKYLNDGYYSIISKYSNKSLDVASAGKNNGTNVQQYETNGTDAQKWKIIKNSDNTYSIISKCNNLYIDLNGANASNNTNIQVYEGNNTKAQKFLFIEEQNNEEQDEIVQKEQQLVENGIYEIASAINQKYVIDIANSSIEDEANIQLYTKWKTNTQRYKITYLQGGYYSIISEYSNKSLDVEGAQKENGANVQQYEANGTDAQKWKIIKNSDNTYSIISKCNNLYLDVDGANAKKNTNIQMYEGNSTKAQKFLLISEKKIEEQTITNGIYEIASAINQKYVLDVTGPSLANEANIQLYSRWNTNAQRFEVTFLEDGYYSIISKYSNKSLDVASAQKENGVNVQQYETNGTDAQKWKIIKNSDNTYSIISKCNNLYLDAEAAKAKEHTNIQMYEKNNTKAQKFVFIRSTVISKNYEINQIDTNRYPRYKELIENLINNHPNWNFKPLYTGINFSEAVYGEYSNHSANLVEKNYGEWVCPVCGSKQYYPGWYGASDKAIAYYMDSRNFLNESNVFQFLDVNEYNTESVSLNGINARVKNTFLESYANDINNACRNTNTNPYYVIARLIQENGSKGSATSRGMDGGNGKLYYNPFNINANGSDVIGNALKKAKAEGWDSMQKAIEGGITFLKKNWLENYQNTLYQNKFDIDSTNGTSLYSHQYMQGLEAAYSEAKTLKSCYDQNTIESNFTFIIPIYEGMSENLASMPSSQVGVEEYPINVIVNTESGALALRSEASVYSSVITRLPKGTTLLSIKRGVNSSWQEVVTKDGQVGFMSGQYLKQIDDEVICNYKAYIKTNYSGGVSVRTGPSTLSNAGFSKIDYLKDYTKVTVIDDSTYKGNEGNDWVQWARIVLDDGRQAFVPLQYVKK